MVEAGEIVAVHFPGERHDQLSVLQHAWLCRTWNLGEEPSVQSRGGPSSGGGTRTPDTRIMIPLPHPLNLEGNDVFGEGAARGAAHESMEEGVDAGLSALIEAWNTLPPAIREAILAVLRAAE